jgi:2,3-bisphosphoglycerate-independent phosphoglycerate mutase
VINFNFRADRARQITRCLARESGITAEGGRDLPDAAALDKAIPRDEVPKDLQYVCMTEYDAKFKLPVVVPSERLTNILANVMANLGLRNLRVAETEKYAHVTFFFNGGVEKPFPGEERVLIQSPKVATYDLQPEMSAKGVAEAVVKAIEDKTFDVVIANFANADMVGHSGKIPPTIRAVEAVDGCLGEIYAAIKRCGGIMLVTDDCHGGPRQRRADDRSCYGRSSDGAHHQSSSVHLHRRRREAVRAASGWCIAGHSADRARCAEHCAAEGDDRARSADREERVRPSSNGGKELFRS